MMAVREVCPQDADDLTRLLDQLGYGGTEAFIQDRIRMLTEHPDAGILVCEAEGRVAGFLAYQFIVQVGLAGDFCRITYFCVDSEFRGIGVGTVLEASLASIAERRGCDRIEVHCGHRRVDAHAFYKNRGYRESPKYFIRPVPSVQPDDGEDLPT
jgi:GNAT superfamily N-acetyltransferase